MDTTKQLIQSPSKCCSSESIVVPIENTSNIIVDVSNITHKIENINVHVDDKQNENKPTKIKKANRCYLDTCNKKLNLIPFECKCTNKYCNIHRLAEQHNCTYDYKTIGRKELSDKNVKVVADKIIKI